ncbi:MAG: hypothetical protein ACOYVD_16050 [Bacillota bacterium]
MESKKLTLLMGMLVLVCFIFTLIPLHSAGAVPNIQSGTSLPGVPAGIPQIGNNGSGEAEQDVKPVLAVQWEKTFGDGKRNYQGAVVRQTKDGGYILAGSANDQRSVTSASVFGSHSYIEDWSLAYIFKTDAAGNKLWDKYFGQEKNNFYTRASDLRETADGGFIVTGQYTTSVDSFGTENPKVSAFLLKLDAAGNTQWEQYYVYENQNADSSTLGNKLQITADGGYLIAGTYSTTSSDFFGQESETTSKAVLIKTDDKGNQQWIKGYSSDKEKNAGYAVLQVSDGGYILLGSAYSSTVTYSSSSGFGGFGNPYPGGSTGSSQKQLYGIYLVKTDSDGNKLWEKIISQQDTDLDGYDLQSTFDGGYVVVGSGGVSPNTIYLLKTDAHGNKQWDKLLAGDSARSFAATPDKGYIIAGNNSDFIGLKLLLVKTDARGNEEWSSTIGKDPGHGWTADYYKPSSVLVTPKGDYVTAGTKDKYIYLNSLGTSYAVSGRITTADGKPLSGATITFSRARIKDTGAIPQQVTTDADGNWRQTGFEPGNLYKATPKKSAYVFSKENVDFDSGNLALDFTAIACYSVSGKVTTSSGAPVAGVTITFAPANGQGQIPEPVKTDASGKWIQTNLVPGSSYTITPAKLNQAFSPAYALVNGTRTELNFTAAAGYMVSGRVVGPNGNGVYNATLTFSKVNGSGTIPQKATTDANGFWKQHGFSVGTTYRVTPESIGHAFAVPYLDFYRTSNTINFTGSPGFTAGGTVMMQTRYGQYPLQGVEITFNSTSNQGQIPQPVKTNAQGKWSQAGFFSGTTYQAMPVIPADAVYTPLEAGGNAQVKVGQGAQAIVPSYGEFNNEGTAVNFTVTKGYSVSGKVNGADGKPLAGVTMTFSQVSGNGTIPLPVITDAEGRWSCFGFEAGTTYKVTPSKNDAVFNPGNLDFKASNVNLDFTAGSAYSVAGRVTAENGTPLAGVILNFSRTNGSDSAPSSVVTGADGSWKQTGFASGVSYKVTPQRQGYIFTPGSSNFTGGEYSYNFTGRTNWAGTWETNWGMVNFTQSGAQVTGSYPGWSGTVTAAVSGERLSGRWSESNFTKDFEITLTPDGNSFLGQWSASHGNRGNWTIFYGRRISGSQGPGLVTP